MKKNNEVGLSNGIGARELDRLRRKAPFVPSVTRLEGNAVGSFVLPMNRGFGWSGSLRQLTDAIASSEIYRFDGTEALIETKLDARLAEPVEALSSLMHVCSRFGPFRGVMGIRLDGWEDQLDSPVIDELCEFVLEHRENVIFVLGVSGDSAAGEALLTRLSPDMSIRLLEPDAFTAQTLADNVGFRLSECGLTMDQGGRRALLNLCSHLVDNKMCSGYRSAVILADDIIEAAVMNDCRSYVTARVLNSYRSSKTFASRTRCTEAKKAMGF